jgi:hypothetical protein
MSEWSLGVHSNTLWWGEGALCQLPTAYTVCAAVGSDFNNFKMLFQNFIQRLVFKRPVSFSCVILGVFGFFPRCKYFFMLVSSGRTWQQIS